MSVNKYRSHVLVLPEDDANRQIANGFLLDPFINGRAVQMLSSAGGWTGVRDQFVKTHRAEMEKYANRHMVLLVDFDGSGDRKAQAAEGVPAGLESRVFIVGVWSKPEDLRGAGLGSFEDVGRELARECRDESRTVWGHSLLAHNAPELDRMSAILNPFLFPEQ